MASNKKRKIDNPGSPPMLSAFAARQSLWDVLSSPGADATKNQNQDQKAAETAVELQLSAAESQTGKARTGSALPARPESSRRAKGKRQSVQDDDSYTLHTEKPSQAFKKETGNSDSVPSTPTLTPISLGPTRPESRRRTSTHCSSFKPTKANYQDKADGRVLLNAAEGERLVVHGSYGIRVRQGEATIAGAVLSASDSIYWVYAPHCHAIPVLRTTEDSIIELHPHPASKELRRLAKLSPLFGNIWNEESPTIRISEKASKADATFQIIFTLEDSPKRAVLHDLVSPAEWNRKLAGLVASRKKTPPVVFLCGPKSSGKSTFGKLLANRLLTGQGQSSKRESWLPVLVLDLDPGQPEYAPPGVISLYKILLPNLSPSFCHPTPYLEHTAAGAAGGHCQLRAHAIAAVTPAHDPGHFIECALELFSHYQQRFSSSNGNSNGYPLVVNTPGWIQGTGLDILSELVREIRPTEVIYMSQDGPEETVDSLQSVCRGNGISNVIPFYTLPSQPSEVTPSRTSLHLRTMQTMSYFHRNWYSPSTSPRQQQQQQAWNAVPLTERRPWRVRYRGADRGFVGVLCYDHQPAPELLADAINGMVLALVHVENPAAFRDFLGVADPSQDGGSDDGSNVNGNSNNNTDTQEEISGEVPLIPNPQGCTLDPRYCHALGLVLVRGIDRQRGELQLLTPLPSDVILPATATGGKDLVLVAGKFDTPSWAYAEDLHYRGSSSLRVSTAPTTTSQARTSLSDKDGDSSSSAEGEESSAEEGVSGSTAQSSQHTEFPWVEMLHGSQKRSAGSRVWRVRRDLGRN
ncbi:hypothetical protein B0T26DRAFT_832431 [Lasiosphaeria miniovina]|uniref:Polynucleotide 5'-hydroxyl-kinase GRC3 n=1 Tax=Lasiosphaeria miniovina TaxID=1954250 RepID=A0AA40ACA1_9PEZI|nr:uncharacterized protein B0T26DRAFT_832431 [Lasiosphaeria miniovina]KAK0713080.1 hypothetical protein B0T26DRAFT_832431 [Lasiosphaeria miniovina]